MFIIFVFVFVFSLTFHGSSGTTPDLDIDIVNCYTVRTKPIRITGDPDDQLPGKWSSVVCASKY